MENRGQETRQRQIDLQLITSKESMGIEIDPIESQHSTSTVLISLTSCVKFASFS